MSAEKQKFYIVAHNPNTVAEAEEYLKAGANALEPDVCFSSNPSHPDRYYVSHDHVSSNAGSHDFDHEHSLAVYMRNLKDLILRNNFKPALIWFDYKDGPSGDINEMLKIVHDNFTVFDPICANVAIMVSVASLAAAPFLYNYDQTVPRCGICIDEEDDPMGVQQLFINAKQKRFAYADGIATFWFDPKIYKALMLAKVLQAQAIDPSETFKMAHAWVLADSDSIRNYLDISIDGIMVNLSTVATLKAILQEKHYLPVYELAQNGYDPWGAQPVPQYWAIIQTRDVDWAGTDAPVKLTLNGVNGSVVRAMPTAIKNVLEKGETDYITFPAGGNIGEIISLTVEIAQPTGQAPDWLPQLITAGSNLLQNPVYFNYGPDEWVKFGFPITKLDEPAPVM